MAQAMAVANSGLIEEYNRGEITQKGLVRVLARISGTSIVEARKTVAACLAGKC
jgi:hypothetical protein